MLRLLRRLTAGFHRPDLDIAHLILAAVSTLAAAPAVIDRRLIRSSAADAFVPSLADLFTFIVRVTPVIAPLASGQGSQLICRSFKLVSDGIYLPGIIRSG